MKGKQRGITLIALVITIIVLLILAGVSIATLTGQYLTQAKNSKTASEKAEAEERIGLIVNEWQIEKKKDDGMDLETFLNSKVTNKELDKVTKNEDGTYIIEVNGYKAIISEEGELVGKITESETTTPDSVTPGKKVTGSNKYFTDDDGDIAKIPVGFAIVPGLDDISEGLVISDEENDVDNLGNQFVWIPVTEETYKRNTSYGNINKSDIVFTDKNYLPDGIAPTIDSNITDEKQIGNLNETAEKQAVLDEKASGFYISRYEATIEGTTPNGSLATKTATDGSVKPMTKKAHGIWNSITQENSKIVAKSFINNDNVKSALCSGIQWDATMTFVNGKDDGGNPSQKFYTTTVEDSRHTGGSASISGQNEADKVANIYDLEGNATEYVAEKIESGTIIFNIRRGGANNNNEYAAYRRSHNGGAYANLSFRFVLYVM